MGFLHIKFEPQVNDFVNTRWSSGDYFMNIKSHKYKMTQQYDNATQILCMYIHNVSTMTQCDVSDMNE